MPRERNPNRDKAYQIWLEHNGDITNRRIAEMLGENEKVVAVWKQRDKWNVVQQSKSKVVQQKKGGAPKGNKNAAGNKSGGPDRNDKAVKHGFFRKYLPDDDETREIYDNVGQMNPLDLLWENIQIKFTAIVRAQKIMFVWDRDDLTRVLKRTKDSDSVMEREYELQHAWDKQASFLQAQARAMTTLASMIRQYEEMCCRLGWADEEQQLRIQKLQAEVNKLKAEGEPSDITNAKEAAKSYMEALNGTAEEVWGDEETEE